MHSHILVTRLEDTVYCNLIQRRPTYIAYSEVINNKEIIKGIPSYEVKEIKKIKIPNGDGNDAIELSFLGGVAKRTVGKPSGLTNGESKFLDEAYKGVFLNANASYFFKNIYGIGLQYNYFGSSGSGSMRVSVEGDMFELPLQLDVRIHFLAFRTSYIIHSKDLKLRFGLHIGLGGLFYKEEGSIDGIYTKSTGATFASNSTIDLAYYFTDNLAISFNAGLTTGHLSSIDVSIGNQNNHFDLEGDDKINLSYYQFGGGLILKL